MFRVHVSGRLLIDPTTQITTRATGLVLRIDDDARPEFWLTVSIDADTLANLAALVAAGTDHSQEAQK